jgi:hypothetical protein
MSYHDSIDAYIQPQYTALTPTSQNASATFSQELMIFLNNCPEFLSSKSHMEFLRYCFDHYINCDPVSRDLPLQEKLKQAGEMAKNFLGIVIGKE